MNEAKDSVLIDVTDLTIGWSGDAVLQENATFQVERGDVFVILGGSGCGKSTLLRHLVGLEQPISGSISIAGLGTPRLDVGRPPFGVMFQGGALFGSLTIGENVALPIEQWTKLPPTRSPRSCARSSGSSGSRRPRTSTPPRSPEA